MNRVTAARAAVTLILALAAAGCGDETTGTTILLKNPDLPVRFVCGTTRGHEVEALLGGPRAKTKSVVPPAGLNSGMAACGGVPPSGKVETWAYSAHRNQEFGPWPFRKHRHDFVYLDLVFDAQDVVRGMSYRRHEGEWEPMSIIGTRL